MTNFAPVLTSKNAKYIGGSSTMGPLDPNALATRLFKGEVPGEWLFCYMVRRFGWPNIGSDGYKDLASWVLTTPISGLFLVIRPYIGGGNLHFGICYNRSVKAKLMKDPGAESYHLRSTKAVLKWWQSTGQKLYSLGTGKAVGDEDVLVHTYGEKDGQVYGLWERKPTHKGRNVLPAKNGMILWWISRFIEKKHPEFVLPKMSKSEQVIRKTDFHRLAEAAIETTLKDLLRPTNVRDLSFTVFGDIERTPRAIHRFSNQDRAEYFPDAGCTPEYLYGRKRRSKRKAAA